MNKHAPYILGQPIIFTGGLALGNPGPCKAAAICLPDGLISESTVSDLAVSTLRFSISYHGKLCALRLATAFVANYCGTHFTRQTYIFCDYKSAIVSSASLYLHICARRHSEGQLVLDLDRPMINYNQN